MGRTAKDFAYEYERVFRVAGERRTFEGVALFIDKRNGSLNDETEAGREAARKLRDAGILARLVKGTYESQKYANALRGSMLFIECKRYTEEQRAIIDWVKETYDR